MRHMQRIAAPFFEGGFWPGEADEWRLRLERNFWSIRCPMEYQIVLAVHYLSGDAHLWWPAIEGEESSVDLGKIPSGFQRMYVLRAAFVELASSIEEDQCEQVGAVAVPYAIALAIHPRSQHQQPQQCRGSASDKGGKPVQG
ncbi:unnamed protein product [Microthlaspi erraticum]|uniref:Retrotransposon gag domain-containing protein n=1 Tax=Microthlaspi erraticum TaxID=1685480 RepID=A0A6D2JYB9_9BRAS|nr:unnamed protein product [Microthlaspi erraticum]CAA7056754.1 unnamed protein product [Microthlaspi erraticum]